MKTVPVNSNEVLLKINKRILQAKNTAPIMKNIGVDMKNKSQYRFKQEKDPNGVQWARNSPVTLARKKGDKPGSDTGRLRNSITNKSTKNIATAGTNVEYAPTMQFGAKQGKYGYIISNRAPIPWGNVPSRKFLGFSKNQRKLYKKWIKDYLLK